MSNYSPEEELQIAEEREMILAKVYTTKLATLRAELQAERERAERMGEKLRLAERLQNLTLDNEIRWMQNHENLSALVQSLWDWKSPDGVLQVKDLKWFKDQFAPPAQTTESTEGSKPTE